MEFKDSPEKIVALRRQLKMKQYDFETENFTRGYLGLIESRRRKLTRFASDIIVKRFRERVNELGLNIEIDDDYFIRTPREDAEKYCREELEKEDNLTEGEITQIIEICDTYDLSESKAKALLIRGLREGKSNKYQEAYMSFINAINFINKDSSKKLRARIYNNLAICRSYLLDHSGASQYYNMALQLYKEINEIDSIVKVSYNLAICNKKMKIYDKSIENVDYALSFINKKDNLHKYIDIMIVKANCYSEMNNYDDAISIYHQLTEDIKYIHEGDKNGLLSLEERLTEEDKKKMSYIYSNLGDIYICKGNNSKAMDYFNDAEKIREKIQPKALSHIYLKKAQVFLNNDMVGKAMEYCEMGLESAEKYNDYEYMIIGYEMLIQCNVKNGKDKYVEMLLIEELNLLIRIKNFKQAIIVNNSLQEIYARCNNIEKLKWCQSNARDFLQNLQM